jgi:hypothetical protein
MVGSCTLVWSSLLHITERSGVNLVCLLGLTPTVHFGLRGVNGEFGDAAYGHDWPWSPQCDETIC